MGEGTAKKYVRRGECKVSEHFHAFVRRSFVQREQFVLFGTKATVSNPGKEASMKLTNFKFSSHFPNHATELTHQQDLRASVFDFDEVFERRKVKRRSQEFPVSGPLVS